MNTPDYVCGRCHTPTPREELTVKKAVFLEMGAGARTIRSRVLEWLCPSCLQVDVEFNQEAKVG